MARTVRFSHFLRKHYRRTDGRTDGPTDGRTDRPSYRDARTHLKMIGSGVGGIELVIDGFSKKGNGPTDGPTDGRMDGRTDGRTHPLIEMRGRI